MAPLAVAKTQMTIQAAGCSLMSRSPVPKKWAENYMAALYFNFSWEAEQHIRVANSG